MRRWVDGDREPFAELNSDPEVMRYFPSPLERWASDHVIETIEEGFDKNGFGLWALERLDNGEFIGFTGLSRPRWRSHFTPCVEVGWRLKRSAWGHGFASEAGRRALSVGFAVYELDEIVSFTTPHNRPSQAVMQRIGMTRDPADDFDHPLLMEGDALRRHVLYRAHPATAAS